MDILGTQIYSKTELVAADLQKLCWPSPYIDDAATDAGIAVGIVFIRDSEHGQGAYSEEYKGPGFYTQVELDEKSGEVTKVITLNQKCEIEWVKPDGVHRVLADREDDAVSYVMSSAV